MASGFFFGGMAPGILAGADAISNDMKLQSLLQLQVARDQNNHKHADYMKLRSDLIDHMGETVAALKNAHPDWTDLQVSSNPAVLGLKNTLAGFDKNLRLPDTADSIVAGLVAGPSQIQTARMKAEATGTYGKEQAQTQELQARTRVLDQASGTGTAASFNQRFNPDLDTETQLGGKQFQSTGNPRVDNIIKGVEDGNLPPVVSGNVSYKDRSAFASGIEANGINLAQKQLQWKQAEKQIQSLNGPQMTRYVGLNKSVQSTVDEVLNLSKQMQLSGIPALNSAELQGYIQTQGNSPKGQLATQYISAVNTLKEEFANLANGGYAPTDPAWKLADQQINGNYGWQQLPASLTEVKKLINIRLHAIPGMDTLGPGAGNPYTGKGQSGGTESPSGITVHGFTFTPTGQ